MSVLSQNCWCGLPAMYLQEIDPLVTPWDGETEVAGLPAAPKCAEHTTDSMGAVHPIMTIWCAPGDHTEPIPAGETRPDGWTLHPAHVVDGQWFRRGVRPTRPPSVWCCPVHPLHEYHEGEPCYPGCPAWGGGS